MCQSDGDPGSHTESCGCARAGFQTGRETNPLAKRDPNTTFSDDHTPPNRPANTYRNPYPLPTISFAPAAGVQDLTINYLDQEMPGLAPVMFAQGTVTSEMNERDLAIAPDGSEMFYTLVGRNFSVILWMRYEGGAWIGPEAAPFSGQNTDQDPAFSTGGERLFFASKRPTEGEGADEAKLTLFYVDKDEDSW